VKHPTSGRLRTAALVRRLALVAAVAVAFAPACGKKGPPRPPLVKMPAPPDPFVVRRLGDVAYLQLRIPSVNTDKTTPADIERVEIHALTGEPAGPEDIFKSGDLVASIPVRTAAEEAGGPPRPPASMQNGFDQGDMVVVTEQLGPEQFRHVALTPKEKPKKTRAAATAGTGVLLPLGVPPLAPLPMRVYVAVGINHKGQKGAPSAERSIVLVAPASAPSAPVITYTETAFIVSWTPPADAWPPAPSGNVLPSTPIGSRQAFGAFNVYEVPVPTPGAVAAGNLPPAGGTMPTPVNEKPLPGPPLVDKRMTFGKPRCYAVRAVTLFGTEEIEGDASPTTCVSPVDTFPPAAPTSLRAVGGVGSVSLIWDAVKAPDLAGYLVLRADVPNGAFAPLTPEPITTTTFNDMTAKPGVRYAYVVVAVDTSKNKSAPSNRVEESAR
jgi:hypothetical protein